MGVEFYCGLLGLAILPFLAWTISFDRDYVMWKTVIMGLVIQLLLGVFVLSPPGQIFFNYMNDVIVGLLEFTIKGAEFLFGNLVYNNIPVGQGQAGTNAPIQSTGKLVANAGAFFAFNVLPTIIFFSALMSVLYYLGIMQKVVEFIAWIMMKLLGTSGAETLSASSNIFVGQTEAPLVVKPFVKDMTLSELTTVMVGGFATVAGGVMAAYVGLLKSHFPGIAGHLMTASIMSAPAGIVMSKLVKPETERPETRGDVELNVEEAYSNVIDAAAQGAKTGLQLALNVGGMLLAFIALVDMGNFLVGWTAGKIHALVTNTTGLNAFLWGGAVGSVLMSFLVGRALWSGMETKYWMGSLTLVGVGGVLGYFVSPAPVVGLTIGLLAGFFLALFIHTEHSIKFLRSVGLVLLAGVVVGGITFLAGGSQSSAMASILGGGVLGFLAGFIYYWMDPTMSRGITCAIITIGGSTLLFALVSITNIDILTVIKGLTLEKLFGYVFSVFALLMGVPWEDLIQFGKLIGNKMVVNEFVAFLRFKSMAASKAISPRTMVIASYALCGFSNFSSIAIQIGGIGGLAPNRESDLAKLGVRAMLAGTLASYQTAAVAGVMFGLADQFGIDLVNIGASL
ncbi:MAG: nucleoside transporter C-terminal domain-containing protein [bacterium]